MSDETPRTARGNTKQVRKMLDEDRVIEQTDLLTENIIRVVENKQRQKNRLWGKIHW